VLNDALHGAGVGAVRGDHLTVVELKISEETLVATEQAAFEERRKQHGAS